MRQRNRKQGARRFLPSGMDWLEDRVVLSAGVSARIATAAAVQVAQNRDQPQLISRNPLDSPVSQNQQTPLINQVADQINQQFSSFADQFYQLRSSYLTSFGTSPGGNAIDIATFHDRAGDLVGNLAQQVLGVINAVPGGGGLLSGYLQARLNGDQSGSLRHALTTMPDVETSGLGTTGFVLDTGAILQDALISTQGLTQLYNDSLLFTTYGFFNGSLRFFNKSLYSNDLPASSPDQPGPANQVISNIDRHFTTFAQDYRNARSQYFDTVGTSRYGAHGDIEAYRSSLDRSLKNLEADVVNAVRSVAGAGPLSSFLTARIGGDQPGGLRHDLVNLAPVGTTGLSTTGFALTGETYLADVFQVTRNSIQLYNDSLNYVAEGFFNAYAGRFLRDGGAGQGAIGRDPLGQVSVRQGGLVRAQQQLFLPSGPYTQESTFNSGFGGGLGYFNYAPAGFDFNNGFGGLGSGFNFVGTETGVPFRSSYGTGFSFGPLGGLSRGVNVGFNPLIGANPAFGGGFGNTYGVIGPSFSTGFAGEGIEGFSGLGVSPGFGGFFF